MQIDAYFASLGRGMSYFLFCLVIAALMMSMIESCLRLLKPYGTTVQHILNAAYCSAMPAGSQGTVECNEVYPPILANTPPSLLSLAHNLIPPRQ
jgi:hypothetical protein